MGEIADAMLDGDLCAACGSFIDHEGGEGFPRFCSPQCAGDSGEATAKRKARPGPRKRKALRDRAARAKTESGQ